MIELTPIEEAAAEYEREIVHQSTQIAICEINDVLRQLQQYIGSFRRQLISQPTVSNKNARRESRALAELVIESITNDPPFDAADIVAVKDDGERLLNQEFAVEKVRNAVTQTLKGLRYDN